MKKNSGSGYPVNINDMRDYDKLSFRVYLNDRLKKIQETGQFRAKLDPGLNWPGNFFLMLAKPNS